MIDGIAPHRLPARVENVSVKRLQTVPSIMLICSYTVEEQQIRQNYLLLSQYGIECSRAHLIVLSFLPDFL